jgi:predicted dehydrogenase
MDTVRWGIVGSGRMARTMADEIARLSDRGHALAAVASRRIERAREFAACRKGCAVYDSVRGLVADPEIDAVYIATPPSEHAAAMLDCIAANKAVLCEKPFTLDAVEAERVAAEAERREVFVMEAMWTRFLPAIERLRAILASGALGDLRLVIGGGAFVPAYDPDNYLFDPRLGGGALLDAGVYLVSMASMILGAPRRVLATGAVGPTGIDEQDVVLLDHGEATATLYISMRTRRAPDLEILGAHGRIRLEPPMYRPTSLTVWDANQASRVENHPIDGTGYGPQLEAVARALEDGSRECAVMPLAESVRIMQTMDLVRAQIGARATLA